MGVVDKDRTDDGSYKEIILVERFRKVVDAKEIDTRCALCPPEQDGAYRLIHRGPFREGKKAIAQHLRKAHPEAARSAKRRLTPEQQRALAMERSEWKRKQWRGET